MAMTDEERKAKARERARRWREDNLERARENCRRWRKENRDKLREYQRNWCKENRDKSREYKRRWREGNCDRMRECRRKWSEENPEKIRAKSRRRRARKKGATVQGHRVTAEDEARIKAAFRWSCPCCGKALDQGEKASPLDHFVPLSRGGKDATWNLVPMCHKCNGSKHAADPLEWLRRKRYVRAFTRALIDSGHWIDHPHFRHINAPDVGSTE